MDLITALNAAILSLNTGLEPQGTSDEDLQWLDDNSEEAVTRLAELRSELNAQLDQIGNVVPGTKVTINVP